MYADLIRNVAIIAHVDHGKTTLVDQLLYQSGMFRQRRLDKLAGGEHGLIMDSNPLERERGITILGKNCAIQYTDAGRQRLQDQHHRHARPRRFRRRGRARAQDGRRRAAAGRCLRGPMPQTRFVLSKALEHGLKPIVVVNKMDRPDARPDDVVNEVFDLLVELGADDDALDFPVIFASARKAGRRLDLDKPNNNMQPCSMRSSSTCPPRRSIPTRRCRCWSPRWTTPITSAGSASAGSSPARSSRPSR